MANNIHNGITSTATNNNDLFSRVEKARLHSFLDTLTASDEPYSPSGHTQYTTTEDRLLHHAPVFTNNSPTPVLLSPPYLRNITLEQQRQQQAIQRNRSNMKSSGDDMNTGTTNTTITDINKNKKHRVLLEGLSTPLLDYIPHSPSTFPKITQFSATKDATPSPPPPPTTTTTTATTTTATTKPKGNGRGRKPEHELLSEEQKKANHIASEQKRRANIRIGFEQLVEIVPSLNECQRSESLILQKSVEYIQQMVETKNGLRDRVRELQTALGEIPDEDSSEGELDYGF